MQNSPSPRSPSWTRGNTHWLKLRQFGRTLRSWPTAIGSGIVLITIVMMLLSLTPGCDIKSLPKGKIYQRPPLAPVVDLVGIFVGYLKSPKTPQLFNIGLKFQSDLDNGTLSKGLRQVFKNKGISLSDNAAISTGVRGHRWQIVDTDDTYTVKSQKNRLNIYSQMEAAEKQKRERKRRIEKQQVAIGQLKELVKHPHLLLKYPMGTDSDGRDILSKLTASSGAYFLPGLLAISVALSLGVILGSISGYYTPEGQPEGEREKSGTFSLLQLPWREKLRQFLPGLDFPIRYGFDLINALPQLALIFLICATVSTNIYWITFTLGMMGAMQLGGLLRNEIIALRQEEYVEAAIELGLRDSTILRRHLLLTRLSPLLISQAFHLFAAVILVETTLRFFFQIIPDADTSWGKLLVDAQDKIFTLVGPIRELGPELVHLWWFWFFPALLIAANIIAFYLLADAFSVKREN